MNQCSQAYIISKFHRNLAVWLLHAIRLEQRSAESRQYNTRYDIKTKFYCVLTV
jgi:hypothetical protein